LLIALNIRLIDADFKKIFKISQFLFSAVGANLRLNECPVEENPGQRSEAVCRQIEADACRSLERWFQQIKKR